MKSLEIINAKLNIVKQQKEDLVMEYKYFNDDNSDEIFELDRKITELLIIKQDLEVLEIIKNCRFVGYQKFTGNILIIDNITDEQYQKIEQWVEEQYGD